MNDQGGAPMKDALALKVLVVAISLTAFAGGSAADPPTTSNPPTTPNGWEGACNMLRAGAGMDHAMSVDNEHGNIGMFAATDRTSDAPDCQAS